MKHCAGCKKCIELFSTGELCMKSGRAGWKSRCLVRWSLLQHVPSYKPLAEFAEGKNKEMKNKNAQNLVNIRWAKTTKEEKDAHIAMMNAARLKKLAKIRAKRAVRNPA